MSKANTVWDNLKLSDLSGMRCFPEDGHWYSPDGGSCFVKDGNIYWASGEVMPNTGIRRMMKVEHGEDYSQWSEEKRANVLAETIKKREAYEQQRQEYYIKQGLLIESARTKLTEEEFAAVFESGRDY